MINDRQQLVSTLFHKLDTLYMQESRKSGLLPGECLEVLEAVTKLNRTVYDDPRSKALRETEQLVREAHRP